MFVDVPQNLGVVFEPAAARTGHVMTFQPRGSSTDLAKYESYSPLFLSTTEYMAIGLGLASFTSVIPHTYRKSPYLNLASDVYPQFEVSFRRDIARQFRMSLRDERDVLSHLMQAYPEVPRWWYAGVGVTSW